MASTLLSFLAWTFLPDAITTTLQNLLYASPLFPGPPPHPNSPTHATHRRLLHTTIVLLYLLYHLHDVYVDTTSPPTLYALLSLPPSVSSKDISSRFRRLALTQHPDKLAPASLSSPSGDPAASAAREAYLALARARDILTSPAARAAYDRHGPAAAAASAAAVAVPAGELALLLLVLRAHAPWYVATLLGLFAARFFGLGKAGMGGGMFWRVMGLVALAALELRLATAPVGVDGGVAWARDVGRWGDVGGLVRVTGLLPWQVARVAREGALACFLAAARLGGGGEAGGEDGRVDAGLAALEARVGGLAAEAGRMLQMDVVPFVRMRSEGRAAADDTDGGGAETSRQDGWDEGLQRGLEEWLFNSAVRADPEVRAAVGRVMEARLRRPDTATAGAGDNSGSTPMVMADG